MGKKVLMLVAAHADDIEFLYAGTALKYHETQGYEIVYVMSTNNMSGNQAVVTDAKNRKSKNLAHPWYDLMPIRKREAARAAMECFHTEPIHLDYPQRHYRDSAQKTIELRYGNPRPDCVAPDSPTILTAHEDAASVERVSRLILEKNPEVILTHPPMDYTDEHTCTSMLVKKAFEKAKGSGYDGSLLHNLPVTSLNFGKFFDRWETFIDTTGFYRKKLSAIGIHASQVPFVENLELRDETEGKLLGCESAETFIVCHLSETRKGALTDEFRRNYDYCIANWARLFLGGNHRQKSN
jgi:LmbE family N-acetylglucosaminyl deacetylase